jgi:hypothetical protein
VPGSKDVDDVRALIEETDEMKGLGDAVSRVTKRLGIRECDKCKKRRKWLNERVPFNKRKRRTLEQARREKCHNCG